MADRRIGRHIGTQIGGHVGAQVGIPVGAQVVSYVDGYVGKHIDVQVGAPADAQIDTRSAIAGRRSARRSAQKGLPHERQPFSDSSKQCKFSGAELI